MSVGRKITHCNSTFASLFNYEMEDIVGKSLEMLYPSRFEFLDRGEKWAEFLHIHGEHSDERIMLARKENPVWIKVRGRCRSPRDPYQLMVCTFEEVTEKGQNPELTIREYAIVKYMQQGLTSKEIARKLMISHRTVETYKNRLMVKVGARNSMHLVSLIK